MHGKDLTPGSFIQLSASYQDRFTATGMLRCQVFSQLHRQRSYSTRRCQLILHLVRLIPTLPYILGVDPATYLKGIMCFLKSLWYCVCGICLFFPQHNFVQQYVDKTALIYFLYFSRHRRVVEVIC